MSDLTEQIKLETFRRARNNVIARVLKEQYRHHAKTGFKTDCQCNYCKRKRVQTSRLAYTRGLINEKQLAYKEYKIALQSCLTGGYTYKELLYTLREKARKEARELLKESENESMYDVEQKTRAD